MAYHLGSNLRRLALAFRLLRVRAYRRRGFQISVAGFEVCARSLAHGEEYAAEGYHTLKQTNELFVSLVRVPFHHPSEPYYGCAVSSAGHDRKTAQRVQKYR